MKTWLITKFYTELVTFGLPGFRANLPNSGDMNKSNSVISNLLNFSYMFAAIVCTVILIIAGIKYISAAGDSSKITEAKKTITGAIVGLLLVIMAFAITNFILGAF